MSGANSLQAQLGVLAGSPCTRRDPMTLAEMAEARRLRAMGASWDAIGRALGRPGVDVLAVMGPLPPRATAPPVVAVHERAAPRRRASPRLPPAGRSSATSLKAGSPLSRFLVQAADAAEPMLAREFLRPVGMDRAAVSVYLGLLTERGLLERVTLRASAGWGKPKYRWRVTDAGLAETGRLRGRP